jgi:hypothetical protein
MSNLRAWFLVVLGLVAGVAAVTTGTLGDDAARQKNPTAEEVARLWEPRLKSATDYGRMGGSPDVAAYSFGVVGPTFEEMWKHYAKLCGMKQPYAEKTFLVSSGTGPNGTYVVSDWVSSDGKGGRGVSVFLLKTEAYIATVTFQPDPGGKSISGSLSVVVP